MSRRKRFTRNLGRSPKAPLPARTTKEWIRFEHEDEPIGMFQYYHDARYRLEENDREELIELYRWFWAELHAPEVDERRRFWFCSEAAEYVSRARRFAELVSKAGFPIVERRTRRIPGKVRWEDSNQVAVITYRDAPQPRRRSEK